MKTNIGVIDKTDKRVMSFSSISTYLRCPMQYYYRYILGKKIPPSGAMYLGSQWHGGPVETNYRQKINTKKDIKIELMKEIFIDGYDKGCKSKEVAFEKDEKKRLRAIGLDITVLYGKEMCPRIMPTHVEERFTLTIAGVEMVGYWDLLDKKGFIRDNKSKAKTPSEDEVNKNLQFSIYSYGYRKIFKKKEKGMAMDCAIKTKVPKAVTIHTTRNNKDMEDVEKIVKGVTKAIQSEIFYPCRDGWSCSEKWCGYWGLCRGIGKKQ